MALSQYFSIVNLNFYSSAYFGAISGSLADWSKRRFEIRFFVFTFVTQ
jgi:hypothetical protein